MKNKTNRREFLKITGTTVAGAAVAASALSILPQETPAITLKKEVSLETWLLNTGRGKIDPDLVAKISLR